MAKQVWTFQGRVRVEDVLMFRDVPSTTTEAVAIGLDEPIPEPETLPLRPLSEVRIEISGSSLRKGGWRKWVGAHTDETGYFQVSYPGTDKPRRFRVRVFLENGRLRVGKIGVHGAVITSPIVVWTDEPTKKSEFRTDPAVYFGDMVLRDSPAITRATRNHVRRAALYATVQRLRDGLCAVDPWLDFPKGINIIYPAGIATWAEGTRVHIVPRYFKISTVIHEVMHIWNYQHSRGTANWPAAALSGMSTHNKRENPNIAFHEGFASWAADELLHHVLSYGTPERPYNKRWLAEEHDILSLSGLESNADGVASGLRLLTYPEPYRLLLGTLAERPPGTDEHAGLRPTTAFRGFHCPTLNPLTVWDILLAFRANSEAGVSQWNVSHDLNGLLSFIERLSDLYPDRFHDVAKQLYLRILNPRGSEEMSDSCVRLGEGRLDPFMEDDDDKEELEPEGRRRRNSPSKAKVKSTKKRPVKKKPSKKSVAKKSAGKKRVTKKPAKKAPAKRVTKKRATKKTTKKAAKKTARRSVAKKQTAKKGPKRAPAKRKPVKRARR